MDPKQIASVCHEANRAITAITKDVPVQPPWNEAPEEMIRSSVQGVIWRMDHPSAPASGQHDEWMRWKLEDGWTLGPVKNSELKTHPALVPYEELPPGVKAKDSVFTAIVLALAPVASLLLVLFGFTANAQTVLTDSVVQVAPKTVGELLVSLMPHVVGLLFFGLVTYVAPAARAWLTGQEPRLEPAPSRARRGRRAPLAGASARFHPLAPRSRRMDKQH